MLLASFLARWDASQISATDGLAETLLESDIPSWRSDDGAVRIAGVLAAHGVDLLAVFSPLQKIHPLEA
ncbi:hypothetical protein DENSPDRAFT_932228 [Dentipellis sp. KUC8613]|nr:hypothetical protein DENSPDRAFT_932228 [Dentipellis sp. KUC8613]